MRGPAGFVLRVACRNQNIVIYIYNVYKGTLHNLWLKFQSSRKQANATGFPMPPVRHEHCLIDIEKEEIIILSKNKSHAKIDEELHIPRQTISNFLQSYNLPHFDRPRQTSATFDR